MPTWKFAADRPGRIAAADLTQAVRRGEELEVAHATIEGDVDLASVDYPHRLVVRNCTINGLFNAPEARFSRSVDFTQTTFRHNLNLARAIVGGRLLLTDATIEGHDRPTEVARFQQLRVDGDLGVEGLRSGVTLEFDRARIAGSFLGEYTERGPLHCAGSLRLLGAIVSGPVILAGAQVKEDVVLNGAELDDDLYLAPEGGHRTEIGRSVTLYGARIGGELGLSGARIHGELNLLGAEVKRGLFCTTHKGHRTEVSGSVTLINARLGRLVNFGGARIGGDLNLQDVKLEGDLFCTPRDGERPEVCGTVMIHSGRITGRLTLSGLKIGGDLNLSAAEVSGGLFCTLQDGHRFEVGGTALLPGAKVSGEASFNGAKVGGDLNFASAEIHGGLFATVQDGQRLEVAGSVLMPNTHVTGWVNYSGARIDKELSFVTAEVQGSIFCMARPEHRTEVLGSVVAPGVKVSGEVNFSGACVAEDFNLASAEIHGGLFCGVQERQRTEVGGSVLVHGARVGGWINFSGARVGRDFNLIACRVEDGLLCGREGDLTTEVVGDVSLQASTIRIASLDGRMCGGGNLGMALAHITNLELEGALPLKVDLQGFQFQQLSGVAVDHLDLLARTEPYQKSTYVAVETWLRNQGEDEAADRVYVAMRRRNRKEGRLWGLVRVLDWLLDWTIAYGTRSHRLLLLFVLVLAATFVVFSTPRAVRFRGSEDAPPQEVPAEAWTGWDVFWFSVQTSLPIVSISAVEQYRPSHEIVRVAGQPLYFRYDTLASAVSLAGYVMGPLFVGGLANAWLRRRASST